MQSADSAFRELYCVKFQCTGRLHGILAKLCHLKLGGPAIMTRRAFAKRHVDIRAGDQLN